MMQPLQSFEHDRQMVEQLPRLESEIPTRLVDRDLWRLLYILTGTGHLNAHMPLYCGE